VCYAGAAAFGLVLPLASGPPPVAIGCVVLGISLPTFFLSIANIALTPVIVADVVEDAMGRTIATFQVFGGTAGLIGALTGGAIGEWVGVRSGIWVLDIAALGGVAACLPGAIRVARGHHGDHGTPAITPALPVPSGSLEGIALADEYAHEGRH
jgi:hypothetical protein